MKNRSFFLFKLQSHPKNLIGINFVIMPIDCHNAFNHNTTILKVFGTLMGKWGRIAYMYIGKSRQGTSLHHRETKSQLLCHKDLLRFLHL
jgi:hypothetical protein